MATQLQIRRGTTAQMNAFTGAEGELAVNTSTDTVHVHDGSTAGGFALAKADGSNIATYAGSFTTLAASGASTLTGAVGINIAPTSYKLTVNSGATTETTAAAIGYNGDAGTNLYINTDHGNNLVSLYASGDVSKEMRFLSGTLEVMRLGTSGNVGIGTSSPDSLLHVAGAANLRIAYNGTSVNYMDADTNIFRSGNGAERMRIDSSGNLLVGASSASAKLTVGTFGDTARAAQFHGGSILIDGGAATDLIMGDGNVAYMSLQTTDDATAMKIRDYSGNADLVTVERASGNVGIGTSSPTQELEIKAASVPTLKLNQAGTYGAEIALRGNDLDIAGSANAIVFYTGGNNDVSTTERMRIDSSGNVMVGTTTQYFARLSVQGEANQNAVTVRVGTNGYPAINFQNTAGAQQGYITTNASSVQYISISDQRAKENIADADDAGSKIDSIQVRKFDWIVDGSHQDYGMIAQELQAVAPEAVSGDADSENMMGVDYSKLVPMLVKEIQSLRTRVQELENN